MCKVLKIFLPCCLSQEASEDVLHQNSGSKPKEQKINNQLKKSTMRSGDRNGQDDSKAESQDDNHTSRWANNQLLQTGASQKRFSTETDLIKKTNQCLPK